MKTARKNVGEVVASIRERNGLTQTELAQRMGVTSQHINQFERGGGADPKLSTLNSLALALGCTISELLGEK